MPFWWHFLVQANNYARFSLQRSLKMMWGVGWFRFCALGWNSRVNFAQKYTFLAQITLFWVCFWASLFHTFAKTCIFDNFWSILTKKTQFLNGNFSNFFEFQHKSILSHRVVCEKQKSQSSLFVMSRLFLVMLCGKCKVCIVRMILSILGYFRPKIKVYEHFHLLISIIMFCS